MLKEKAGDIATMTICNLCKYRIRDNLRIGANIYDNNYQPAK